jgi:septum formation protein
MRKIILASTSPRRKELLAALGLEFTVVPSHFEENLDNSRTPEDIAMELGRGKALSVAKRFPDAIVIGSDTIVTVGDVQLGKASTLDEARAMWQLATSAENKITSSVAVICMNAKFEKTLYDNAFVTLKPYDETVVEAYLSTDDWHDKAGAWSIQQCRHLMTEIRGDEETILGLPTRLVVKLLADAEDQI